MTNYGMKVSKEGVSVGTGTDFDMVFTSKRDIFKIFQNYSGTISSPGTATITHGLGYSPAFLYYLDDNTNNYHLFGGSASVGTNALSIVYNNQVTGTFSVSGSINFAREEGGAYSGGGALFGRTPGGAVYNGAIRMTSVTVPQSSTISAAELKVYLSNRLGGTVPVTVYGINEDNTGSLSSDTFGRTKTAANYNVTIGSNVGTNQIWNFDIKNVVQEIVDRGGWSSGNSMGIFIYDNNGTAGHFGGDDYISTNGSTGLTITYSSGATNYRSTIFLNKLDGTRTFG